MVAESPFSNREFLVADRPSIILHGFQARFQPAAGATERSGSPAAMTNLVSRGRERFDYDDSFPEAVMMKPSPQGLRRDCIG